MTARQRQASGSAETLPSRPGAGKPPAAGHPDSAPGEAPLWEELLQSVSPEQRQELLSLARRQGVLYGPQLPAAPPPNGAPRDPPPRQLLGQLLAGQVSDLAPA